jgi:beta-galactosidase
MHLLSSLQAVAHGADSVQYFQWRKSRGSCEKLHGAVVDHVGHGNTRVFRDVTGVGQALEKLREVAGTANPAEVAVVYDWQNRWAVEGIAGIVRGHRRNYDGTCASHYGAFWRQGITVDVPETGCDFSRYRLVVAPMLYMLKPGVAERIAKFVEQGGTFVGTYLTGIANENDQCFLGGWPGEGLRKVFGLWTEETDGLYPDDRNTLVAKKGNSLGLKGSFEIRDICDLVHAEGCEVLAEYGSDFYAGRPALTVNRFGRGEAWYVACRLDEKFQDAFFTALARRIGLRRNLEADLPEGVTVQSRTDGTSEFLFVMNFNAKPVSLGLGKGAFPELLGGGTVSGRLDIPGYGVKVLKRQAVR